MKITRDIRFRVWDNSNQKMYPVVRGIFPQGFAEFKDKGMTVDAGYYRTPPSGDLKLSVGVVGEDFELLQYTGLKDCNGREIYEGDILKNLRHGGQLIEVFWEGIQDKHMGWLDFGGWSFRKLPGDENMKFATYSADIEVIGNIYENPELLKEEVNEQ